MKTLVLALLCAVLPGAVGAQTEAAAMQAIRYHSFGGPEVLKLEEVPRPTPAADELLVRVAAAGVNPVDAKVRSGAFKRGGEKLPAIPGYDVSGVVEEIGAKVTRFKKGDPVYAYLSLQRGGAYAQYAIVKEEEAAARPAKLSDAEAAAVPLAALTAWQALVETAKLQSGQSVLIHGGSGGVGSFAVQIAKARGAKVFATASTRNQETLKKLGADVPIDYTTTKFEEVAKEVDVVLDMISGDTLRRSYDVLKKGGFLVSILGPPDRAELEKRGLRGEGILVRPSGAMLGEISQLIEAGKIDVVVSEKLPLAEAAKAHRQIETGHTRGKIVLTVP